MALQAPGFTSEVPAGDHLHDRRYRYAALIPQDRPPRDHHPSPHERLFRSSFFPTVVENVNPLKKHELRISSHCRNSRKVDRRIRTDTFGRDQRVSYAQCVSTGAIYLIMVTQEFVMEIKLISPHSTLPTKRPKNSETHFKVVVVSSQFESVKTPIQRHRLINAALAKELEGPVHALSIVAKSPSQWEKNQVISASPSCKGGDGSLPKRNG